MRIDTVGWRCIKLSVCVQLIEASKEFLRPYRVRTFHHDDVNTSADSSDSLASSDAELY